jgi:hypothetical protein
MAQVTSTVADRAYAMAEMWANDQERLSALMQSEMSVDDFKEICQHLATAFVAFTDDSVSREQTARAFWLHLSMIHGIVVERIFLPVAERLAKQDHDEKTWALGWAPVQIANADRALKLAA